MRLLPLLVLSLCASSLATPVEVTHPVADFLRRLEEKGAIPIGLWSTLPRPEAEIAAALGHAAEHGELGAWDRRRLERFLDEFDPERKRRGTRLRHEDSLITVHGNVEYYTGIFARDSIPEARHFAFGSFTPAVQATYGRYIDLTASATVGMERGVSDRFRPHYEPVRGLPYNTNRAGQDGIPQPVSTFDGFRMVTGVGDGNIRLEFGQDWNQWGPGRRQHSTLGPRPHFWAGDSLPPTDPEGSAYCPDWDNLFNECLGSGGVYSGTRSGYRYPGEAPPLPQMRLRVGTDRWEYVKIVAQRTGLWSDSAAPLVAHRLQVRLGDWRFGATEMLAVGIRSPEWLLFFPAVPLVLAEHSTGDRDNVALSVDAEWILRGHGRLYGEFFVDDYSGPPLDFWGNKFAWVLGGSWQDPFGFPAELHAEYAHVDPWVYGHHLRNTQLQSYGALLGSGLPPNSRSVLLAAHFPLPRGVDASVEWFLRQRDLKSPGGSIFEVRAPDDPDVKFFLDRDVETRHEVSASAEWNWRRHVRLRAGAGGLWVENWRGHPGESLASLTAFGELYLRY